MSITFDEITDITDARILQWLDIYEESFPYYERGNVSSHLEDLFRLPVEGEAKKHRLAALDANGTVLGIARYTYRPELSIVYLIYFAVAENQRNQGLGKMLFAEVCHRIAVTYPTVALFTWEVERADKTRSKSGKELAARRVNFYKRQGGILVRSTGHAIRNRSSYPRLPLDVMYFPLRDISVKEALECIGRYFQFPNAPEQIEVETD